VNTFNFPSVICKKVKPHNPTLKHRELNLPWNLPQKRSKTKQQSQALALPLIRHVHQLWWQWIVQFKLQGGDEFVLEGV